MKLFIFKKVTNFPKKYALFNQKGEKELQLLELSYVLGKKGQSKLGWPATSCGIHDNDNGAATSCLKIFQGTIFLKPENLPYPWRK